MIHKFTIENFYSFLDKSEVSFCARKDMASSDAYAIGNFGDKVTKIMSVSGHNASGKTNLLKALTFVSWFITDSLGHEEDEAIPIMSFAFGSKHKEPIKISVDFEIDKKIFRYLLELDKDKVLYEELQVKKTQKFTYIFKRAWDKDKDNNYDLSLSRLGLPKELSRFIRPKTSTISVASQYGSDLSKKIVEFWDKVVTNVGEIGKGQLHLGKMFDAADFFAKNEDLKKQAEKLLTKFDVGLSGIRIDKIQGPSGREQLYIPVGLHKYDKYPKELSMPFSRESGGTQNLFSLLVPILSVLKKGGLAVLDEFDADLHPHMIPELLKLFASSATNPKNAQLFFSTHHHEIFNRLDKYQILIAEKNDYGSSEVWRLDDIKVRKDDNYYKKYISGAYGGVPNIK